MSHWKAFLDPDARGGRYLAWKEVARATGLSRTTAWRLQKRDEFPSPYVISPGRVGYREDEVEAWRVSRDLRGGVDRSEAAVAPESPPTEETPSGPAKSARAPPCRQRSQDAPPAPSRSGASSSEPVTMAGPTSLTDAVARSARRPRRRSQHAQAIAQQMLFDF